jgi:hypothetical protein
MFASTPAADTARDVRPTCGRAPARPVSLRRAGLSLLYANREVRITPADLPSDVAAPSYCRFRFRSYMRPYHHRPQTRAGRDAGAIAASKYTGADLTASGETA